MKRAFTLIEMMVVLSISLFLSAIVFPTYSRQLERARFEVFASELTGHLLLARRRAVLAGESVHMDFSESDSWRFRSLVEDSEGQWREISRSTATAGNDDFKSRLPDFPLPHPTQPRNIQQALSSLHAPEVIFTPKGSSSATLVFCDNRNQVICAVISGQTGRFRIFTWDESSGDWKVYF